MRFARPLSNRRRQRLTRQSMTLLQVECLEDRVTPAITLSSAAFDPGHILVGDLAGGVQRVALAQGVTIAQALTDYRGRSDVAYAEPDYQVSVAVIPNDPNFGSLYGLNNTGQSFGTVDADIDAPEAWDVTRGSTRVVVGVIDTGIDYSHIDLYQNIWINQQEIPDSVLAAIQSDPNWDVDGDGLITFRDLNDA